jgi:hypothetical protein
MATSFYAKLDALKRDKSPLKVKKIMRLSWKKPPAISLV